MNSLSLDEIILGNEAIAVIFNYININSLSQKIFWNYFQLVKTRVLILVFRNSNINIGWHETDVCRMWDDFY